MFGKWGRILCELQVLSRGIFFVGQKTSDIACWIVHSSSSTEISERRSITNSISRKIRILWQRHSRRRKVYSSGRSICRATLSKHTAVHSQSIPLPPFWERVSLSARSMLMEEYSPLPENCSKHSFISLKRLQAR